MNRRKIVLEEAGGRMITLLQIDKSGNEVFERDYSIALVKNKRDVYGVNIPQSIRDFLLKLFYSKQIEVKSQYKQIDKTRYRIRVHTAIIILMIKELIINDKSITEVNIELCNDIDGHFHEIREMIYAHLHKITSFLKKEDIVQTKFSRTSLVDVAARNLREHNPEINKYKIFKLNLEELVTLIKR